ncbi:hypothetical protein Tco_0598730 [Tanacetum coccineum]
MNRVTDVSEGLLISFYISGLKPVIQRELLVLKPTSLDDAFSLVRVTEARLDDQGPNVVLGIQWLQKLRKVTLDYAQQTMEFSMSNTTYSLKGDESLRMKRISLHHIQALLQADDVYGVYEVHCFSMVTEGIRGHQK